MKRWAICSRFSWNSYISKNVIAIMLFDEQRQPHQHDFCIVHTTDILVIHITINISS